jgi:hypothetical protein
MPALVNIMPTVHKLELSQVPSKLEGRGPGRRRRRLGLRLGVRTAIMMTRMTRTRTPGRVVTPMRRRRHSDNVFVARRKTNEKRKDSDWWLSRGSAGVGTPSSATVTAVAAAAAGPSL